MDEPLRRILALLLDGIDAAAAGVASGRLTADQFQAEMVRRLFEGHVAAWLVGNDATAVSPGAQRLINDAVKTQIDYLNAFADEIAAGGWQAKYAARARLYAGSAKATFWKGRTFGIAMPYYPGDGSTPCLGNCRCSLEVVWDNEEELDASVYWRLGTEEHCNECPTRAARSPYVFKGGVMV